MQILGSGKIWLLVMACSLFLAKPTGPVLAQQYNFNFDSLQREIILKPEDTAKVQAYLDYASQFYYTGSDSAFYYLHRAKKLSEAYPESMAYASTLKQEGDLYAIRGDFGKAIAPYQAGIRIARKQRYGLLQIKLLANLANSYKNLGKLDSAMYFTDQVTAAFKGNLRNQKDSIAYAFHHFQLFDIYRVQGFLKEAITYGETGYKLSLAVKAPRGIGYGLYVLGLKHYSDNPQLGLDYCRQAMEIALSKNIPDLQVYIRSLRAAIYIRMGKYELAEQELLQNKDYQANSIQLVTNSRLSKVYFHQNRLPEALHAYKLARQLADSLDYRSELIEVLENGITIYRGKGDFQMAFQLLEQLGKVKEEVASDALKRDYQQWTMKYQASEKDRQLAEKQLKINQIDNRLHRQTLITVIGLSAIIILGLLALYIYRQQQKLQKQKLAALESERELQTLEAMIQGEENERSRLAKELHDGIGGLLSAVKMHLSLAKNEYPALKFSASYTNGLTLLDEASTEVRKTAHNLLPDMLSRFGLDEALHTFCKKMGAGKRLTIAYQSVGEIGRYKDSFELALYRIVQELIHNIIKHADATEAMVQVSKQGNILSVSVEDQGKGFVWKEGETIGIGLSTMRARLLALGGTIEIDTAPGKGTSIYLEFDTCFDSKELVKTV